MTVSLPARTGDSRSLSSYCKSKDLKKLTMKCFNKSNSGTRGYRKRMYAVWREVGESEVSEQRFADQARAI